jgi:PAS domain S-box-containing protein
MVAHIDGVFEGTTMSFERRERKQDGALRWVRVTLFPDREVSGRVGGAFAVWNDIEDDVRVRDALKSQQAQLRLLADNIPGPIAYLDKSFHYTFVNQAFANRVCKPQDEIYGRTPFEVLTADVAAFLRPVLKRAQGGEHVEYERVSQSPQGELRWMHGRIAPDLDAMGNVRGPLLHRIRHPRPEANGAGPRRARGAASPLHRQHSGAGGVPRRRAPLHVRQRGVSCSSRATGASR